MVHRYLRDQLPAALAGSLQVEVKTAGSGSAGLPHRGMPGDMMAMMGHAGVAMHVPPWMLGTDGLKSLRSAVRLSDGACLLFATVLPNAAPLTPWPLLAASATMAVIIVLTSIWAVNRVTAPLKLLAHAAEELGRDVTAPLLAETGTLELRQAALAFNKMQARVRRLIDNRTHMLAALSHDLRTPLTLLRLRAESLPETEKRERMLATIGEVDAMVGSTLHFARDQALTEVRRPTDLTALLSAIVDDMADAGLPVTMAPSEPIVLQCQPGALRRAMSNLIDNAVKYGGSERVAVSASIAAVGVDIEDSGPGIPEAELQRVFEPFHRLEESRSRETGGTGLGLSIALSIVRRMAATLCWRTAARAGCAPGFRCRGDGGGGLALLRMAGKAYPMDQSYDTLRQRRGARSQQPGTCLGRMRIIREIQLTGASGRAGGVAPP